MKTILSVSEINKLKYNDLVELLCDNCNFIFKKPAFRIKSELKHHSDRHKFCSEECNKKFMSINMMGNNNPMNLPDVNYKSIHDQINSLKCPNCGGDITKYVSPSRLRRSSSNIFCSKECAHKFNTAKKINRIDVKCSNCNNDLKITKGRLKNYKFYFCDRKCQNQYAPKFAAGINRSKLELYLETRLRSICDFELFFNNTVVLDGLELDIWIPSINMAFEINGITHYAPIFGKKKFDRTKKSDDKKLLLCKQKGIELVTIDCRSKKFTYSYGEKILQLIVSKFQTSNLYFTAFM